MNVCIIAQERAHEAAFMVGSQKKRERNAGGREWRGWRVRERVRERVRVGCVFGRGLGDATNHTSTSANAAQRSHVPRLLHRHNAPRATPRTVLRETPQTALRAARQKDGEARAFPLFAFNLNAPMVTLDDFAHHA